MGRRQPWSEFKRELPDRLVYERDIGYLDPEIEPYLKKLNSLPQLATTSTCTGRISIVEGQHPWERGELGSRIIFKTHNKLTPEKLLTVITRGGCNLWLIVSPPILHVRAQTLECATHLLHIARETGHKHSGIVSTNPDAGIVVEIMSSAQIIMPLKSRCIRFYNSAWGNLQELIRLANRTLHENRARLSRLVDELTSNPGPCGDA